MKQILCDECSFSHKTEYGSECMGFIQFNGRCPIIHELKTWNPYFTEIWNGYKFFEIRKNDRHFKRWDNLILKEYDPIKDEYSGKEIKVCIQYIIDDPKFVKEGFVVMSIKVLEKRDGKCY